MNDHQTSLITTLQQNDLLGWILFGAFILAIVAMRSVVGVIKSVSRERTRREIAAYIAEGSMTPEQGEKLLKAGKTCD